MFDPIDHPIISASLITIIVLGLFYGIVMIGEFKYNPKIIKQCKIIQSTNLFDKDGKEIFEGDVVDFRGNRHLVIVENGCFVIDNPRLGFFDSGWSLNQMTLWNNGVLQIKVVGHILSNPELLERS